jgi:histidyl-tRNA synthetase
LDAKLTKPKLDYFIACVDWSQKDAVLNVTTKIRSKGCSANFSYKGANLGKQLKEASTQNAKKCVIIGEEFKDGKLAIKDMATGRQELVDVNEFLSGLGIGRGEK